MNPFLKSHMMKYTHHREINLSLINNFPFPCKLWYIQTGCVSFIRLHKEALEKQRNLRIFSQRYGHFTWVKFEALKNKGKILYN